MRLLRFFRKPASQPKAEPAPLLADLNQQPLQLGDTVEALRYELGLCRLVAGANGPEYESLETGRRVSWLRMVDAATRLQKVHKRPA